MHILQHQIEPLSYIEPVVNRLDIFVYHRPHNEGYKQQTA